MSANSKIDFVFKNKELNELFDQYIEQHHDTEGDGEQDNILFSRLIAIYIDYYILAADSDDVALDALCECIINLTDELIVPYGLIAYLIYNSSWPIETQDIKSFEDYLNYKYDIEDKNEEKQLQLVAKILGKIIRHIQLACHQKKYILTNIQEANDALEGIKKEIDNASKQAEKAIERANEAIKKAEKAKKTSKSFLERLQGTTGAYVAILGIFTSIIIAVFGGVNLLNSALSYLKDKTNFIFFTSIGMICLLVIMQLLFIWVGHLKRELPINKQWDSVVSPHNTFFLILIFILTVLASCNQPSSLESTDTTVAKNRNHTPTPLFQNHHFYIKEID